MVSCLVGWVVFLFSSGASLFLKFCSGTQEICGFFCDASSRWVDSDWKCLYELLDVFGMKEVWMGDNPICENKTSSVDFWWSFIRISFNISKPDIRG